MTQGPPDNPTAMNLSINRFVGEGFSRIDRIEITAGKRLTLRASVSLVSDGSRLGARPRGLFPPEPVQSLVENGHAYDGPIQLTDAPEIVEAESLDDLLDLLTGNRGLPVICFSREEVDSGPVDAGRASRLLAGLCHLRELSFEGSWAFTNRRLTRWADNSKKWSTYQGAVRVYRSGLTWDESPYTHPLFMPMRFPDTDQIPELARQACVEDAHLREFDRWSVPRSRMEEVRARSGASEGSPDGDGWEDLVEELEAERDDLRHELKALREELSQGASTSVAPRSVGEALARVAEGPTTGLVILPQAWDSAAEASFRNHARALEVLEAVAELATAYHSGSLTTDFKTFLGERGVQYGTESATTRRRWAQDYQRTYEGKSVELADHAKVGTGTPENHFRVYWHRDQERRSLVIGHVGNHLRTAQS